MSAPRFIRKFYSAEDLLRVLAEDALVDHGRIDNWQDLDSLVLPPGTTKCLIFQEEGRLTGARIEVNLAVLTGGTDQDSGS